MFAMLLFVALESLLMLAPDVTPLMSKVPLTVTSLEVAMLPLPLRIKVAVPALIVVLPGKTFTPVSVWLPPAMTNPPVVTLPLITPLNTSLAAVMLNTLPMPSSTVPALLPAKLVMAAPLVVSLMLKRPSASTPLEVAMLPLPASVKPPSALMLVRPV